jgi:hypothetical protein
MPETTQLVQQRRVDRALLMTSSTDIAVTICEASTTSSTGTRAAVLLGTNPQITALSYSL